MSLTAISGITASGQELAMIAGTEWRNPSRQETTQYLDAPAGGFSSITVTVNNDTDWGWIVGVGDKGHSAKEQGLKRFEVTAGPL